MKISQITQGVENVDLFCVNGTGTTISSGRPVHLLVGASFDGKSVANIDTLNARAFYGVANRDIPANTASTPGRQGEFAKVQGRLQVYVFAHGTSVTIGAGSPMGPGAAASTGFSSTGAKDSFGPLLAGDTIGASICSGGGLAYAYVNML